MSLLLICSLALSLVGVIAATYADESSGYEESFEIIEDFNQASDYGEFTQSGFDTIEQFVIRLYVYVLERQHDTSGLNHWSNSLRTQRRTGSDVAYEFFFSNEFLRQNLTNEQFVDILYRALLGREADSSGRNHWVSRLESGRPRINVFASFVNSSEFDVLNRQAGIATGTFVPQPQAQQPVQQSPQQNQPDISLINSFVERMYIYALQRPSDPSGFAHWSGRLQSGVIDGSTMAYRFIFSREMINRNLSNDDFIEVLYNALMGRASDPSGHAHWTNRLYSGVSRFRVFVSFVNSTEFAGICARYGITLGRPPANSPHNYTTSQQPPLQQHPTPSANIAGNSRTALVWNLIREQNLTGISDRPEHIAGIIGNLMSETGPALCPFQLELREQPHRRPGLGLMQWTDPTFAGGRRSALENFMWQNGICQDAFTVEMNRHRNSQCNPNSCPHPREFTNRVLEVQIRFMFYELRNTPERQYLNFIDFPDNRVGVAGARSYAELFCALNLRPGPGVGTANDIQDLGVQNARRASAFGGAGNLDRINFGGLAARRDRAETVFRYFLANQQR